MKNIAILTDGFLNWGGGVDFIKQIVLALNAVMEQDKFKIYVLIRKNNTNYKDYKGFKRLYNKLKSKFPSKYKMIKGHSIFSEFEKVTVIEYPTNQLFATLKLLNIDIIFPHFEPSYFDLKIQSIGYLYDCQHKYYPEFFSQEDLSNRDRFFKNMLDKNGDIIVNANSVKSDLIKFFDAKPENIHVLPFTPKIKSEHLNNNKTIIKKYDLPEKYFVISNQFWMHKDHRTAFEAFENFSKTHANIHLICTGLMEDNRKPEYIESLKLLINSIGCKDKIHCLGLISKNEQIEILKGALAVIQPTLFEGGPGGGSVWDAIALGIPAIISDITTNLEIKEQNVFFFNAKNSDDLALKMDEFLLKELVLPSKEELIKKSYENTIKLGNFIVNLIK